jgi:PhzF family phenazine biosynthesis protein
MQLSIYQVDAFTDKLFGGNPAAVIPLEQWIPEALMQQIAMENNLAETAFFVAKEDEFEIRWFTPAAEINLCGHATLASAYVLYEVLGHPAKRIIFQSKSGPLIIEKTGELISMDFPSWVPEPVAWPEGLKEILGTDNIVAIAKSRDLLVELASEEDVINARPDFLRMKETGLNIMITAPGNNVDFVSRFFAPALGIDEDPVTGSAHSQLIPYWSKKLDKTSMKALQLSKRGGYLEVQQKEDRVIMAGKAVYYMKGEIFL